MAITRVVVTGGAGKAGSAVMERLESDGIDARSVDIVETRDPDAPTLIVDLTDLGQTIEAMRDADAIVHLAAVPAPNIVPDGETFRTNMMSTYHVFSAAATAGVERVVWASSETLIGLPFTREDPAYAPIDEDHPLRPESHYALAKVAGEAIADQFSRWTGIPFVSLRISNIMTAADYRRFPSFWDDARIRAWNLWGYVDAGDVAQAVARSLTADIHGHEAFLIAARDTCMTRTSADLLDEVYPNVPRGTIEGHRTLLSIDKASRLLGYAPEHSWRDHIAAG
jgi:nucleoside-diphosphate-sugar epimerase